MSAKKAQSAKKAGSAKSASASKKAEAPPVGAHIWGREPIAEAADVGVDTIQMFVGDPQGWKKPRDDADELNASALDIYVTAPYLINVCSPTS